MNMRTPPDLLDKDPQLVNVPLLEGIMEVSNQEWTAEELENAEIQVQQELLEEEFIAECFEEMMEEEEAEWCYYTIHSQPSQHSSHISYSDHFYSNTTFYYSTEQNTMDQRFFLTSKLNPEAPEFIPRGIA